MIIFENDAENDNQWNYKKTAREREREKRYLKSNQMGTIIILI